MSTKVQPYNATRLITGLALAYLVNPVDVPGPFDDMGVLFFAMFIVGILGMFKSGGVQ